MIHRTEAFRFRSFTGALLVITGLGLPISGMANHFYGFSGLTVARHAWMTAHNLLGFLFVIFIGVHIAFNHHILLKHLKSASAAKSGISREMIWAFLMVAFLLVIGVGHAFLVAL